MSVSTKTRFNVFKRDGFACVYCNADDGALHVAYKVPVSKGGDDSPDNLVTSCSPCNMGKASDTLDQAPDYGQGKYVSVYLPGDLISKWREMPNKSKFVQEAIRES